MISIIDPSGRINASPMAFTAESPPAQGHSLVLKVVQVTDPAFAGYHGPINVRLFFPTPTIGMK